MDLPPAPAFRLPQNRTRITREPDELGKWTPLFPDMLGHRQFGGGAVGPDFVWPSNPKEWQEELSSTELRREAAAGGALGAAGELPALGAATARPRLPAGEPASR
jgi:hypothetical protein